MQKDKWFDGRKLVSAREELGLNQRAGAERIGISRSALSALENEAQPEPPTVNKIVAAYGYPAEHYHRAPRDKHNHPDSSLSREEQGNLPADIAGMTVGETMRFEVTIRRIAN